MKKLAIFEGKKIRRQWNETEEKWYFSVVDVVAALTGQIDFQAARNYWKVLKNRLKSEGSETVTKCNQLKMLAADGKMRLNSKQIKMTNIKTTLQNEVTALAAEKSVILKIVDRLMGADESIHTVSLIWGAATPCLPKLYGVCAGDISGSRTAKRFRPLPHQSVNVLNFVLRVFKHCFGFRYSSFVLFGLFVLIALNPTHAFASTRYWIGGSNNWSNTGSWSASSGGVTDNTLPTSADDVHFDAGSNTSNAAYTVTVDVTTNTKDLMFDAKPGDGLGGTITLAGTTVVLSVWGNASFLSGMTESFSGTLSMRKQTGISTLTTNTVTLGCHFNIAAGGGTVQPADNITLSRDSLSLSISNGTFDPNGKTVTLTGPSSHRLINFTPFYNLTITGVAIKTETISVESNITVQNTLTITGDSAINRLLVFSNTLGTPRTITAAAVSLTNVDFMDITGAGLGGNAAWTGTSLGNALGNSNITFDTSVPQYWKTTTTGTKTWSTAGNWFLGTNGTGGAGRVPLPQDDVVFDASSIGAASTIINIDMPRMGHTVNFTGVTNTPSLLLASMSTGLFGDLTFVPSMSVSDSGTGGSLAFYGRGAQIFTTANVSMNSTSFTTWSIGIAAFGGSLTLNGNLSPGRVQLSNGTFDANGFNVTTTQFWDGAGTANKTLNMGSGTWTLTGSDSSIGRTWGYNSTGDTLNAQTSTIKFTDATAVNKTFSGGGKTYNNIWFSGAGTGNFVINASNTFNDFKADTPPHTIIFTHGTTQTVNTWHVSGQAPDGNTVKFGQTFGTLDSYFSTPDSVANSVTGDIDIRVKVALDDWTPSIFVDFVSKMLSVGQYSYEFYIANNNNPGKLVFNYSPDGTAGRVAISSVGNAIADGTIAWVRVTYASATGKVNFYTSSDGIAWTALGTEQTLTAGAIFDGTNAVNIGTAFSGKIYRAQILNGIGGAVAVDYNPNDQTTGATWTSSGTGEIWTVNGNAIVAATNQMALTSDTTATWAVVKAGGGQVYADYLNIWHSVASPVNTWYAGVHSTNNQSVTSAGSGWNFTLVPLFPFTTRAKTQFQGGFVKFLGGVFHFQ